MLVCLQPDCKSRGLICPVCKEESHKDHEALHLKVFLGELQAKLVRRPTDESEEEPKDKLNAKTLSEHLSALETAKKSIITNLQECVKTLAQSIKEIEKKIQEEYARIRRIILSQVTVMQPRNHSRAGCPEYTACWSPRAPSPRRPSSKSRRRLAS